MSAPAVRVGVAAIVRRGPAVLMGLRKGAHGAGTWSLPGGHLEFGETAHAAVEREMEEETGIDPIDMVVGAPCAFTEDVFDAEHHYITIYAEVVIDEGCDPVVTEPDKCAEWRWCLNRPNGELFLPIRNLLASGYALWR